MERYKLVWCDDFEEFSQAVNDRVREGYEPIGGITVLHRSMTWESTGETKEWDEFYQAMWLIRGTPDG